MGVTVKSVSTVADDDGWTIYVSLFFTPGTSFNVPKFVTLLVIPVIIAVPVLRIFPKASGVPETGLTLIFFQVRELVILPAFAAVIEIVNCVEVPVTGIIEPLARPLILRLSAPLPPVRVTSTTGAMPSVSKTNPEGTVRIMVPFFISPALIWEITGPIIGV